ncbi:hypothetical protein WICPIJ_008750 [Wickerhamomyces pijperi]|uniref:Maf-like protein n=1 Tax=Wickerhamomyces pijperi TaxID=599730 RepID=A0A9P8THH9_WICPI|nr:hypothetical protein WICPIJ_008750 [Wickerhamomyces pijperi]
MLKNQNTYSFYLASTSPRRIEILSQILGIEQTLNEPIKGFKLIKPEFDEDLDKSQYTPQTVSTIYHTLHLTIILTLFTQYVEATALHKFKSIDTSTLPLKSIVLSADTIISFQGKVIEKPHCKEDQFVNLCNFIENSQRESLKVITSVIVYDKSNDEMNQFTEITDIIFDDSITQEIVKDYVDSEDGLKVAGGFKIQSIGGVLIKEIKGDYYNVVGLPLNSTFKVLKKIVDGMKL